MLPWAAARLFRHRRELLNQGGPGFHNPGQDRSSSPASRNVVAALADFDGDGNTDYAFALTPYRSRYNLPVRLLRHRRNGPSGHISYSGPLSATPANTYPPTGGKNGCMTFHGFWKQAAVLLGDRGVSLQGRLSRNRNS